MDMDHENEPLLLNLTGAADFIPVDFDGEDLDLASLLGVPLPDASVSSSIPQPECSSSQIENLEKQLRDAKTEQIQIHITYLKQKVKARDKYREEVKRGEELRLLLASKEKVLKDKELEIADVSLRKDQELATLTLRAAELQRDLEMERSRTPRAVDKLSTKPKPQDKNGLLVKRYLGYIIDLSRTLKNLGALPQFYQIKLPKWETKFGSATSASRRDLANPSLDNEGSDLESSVQGSPPCRKQTPAVAATVVTCAVPPPKPPGTSHIVADEGHPELSMPALLDTPVAPSSTLEQEVLNTPLDCEEVSRAPVCEMPLDLQKPVELAFAPPAKPPCKLSNLTPAAGKSRKKRPRITPPMSYTSPKEQRLNGMVECVGSLLEEQHAVGPTKRAEATQEKPSDTAIPGSDLEHALALEEQKLASIFDSMIFSVPVMVSPITSLIEATCFSAICSRPTPQWARRSGEAPSESDLSTQDATPLRFSPARQAARCREASLVTPPPRHTAKGASAPTSCPTRVHSKTRVVTNRAEKIPVSPVVMDGEPASHAASPKVSMPELASSPSTGGDSCVATVYPAIPNTLRRPPSLRRGHILPTSSSQSADQGTPHPEPAGEPGHVAVKKGRVWLSRLRSPRVPTSSELASSSPVTPPPTKRARASVQPSSTNYIRSTPE